MDELLDLDVARYAKRLTFSPKFYHKTFWKEYLRFIDEETEEMTYSDLIAPELRDNYEEDNSDHLPPPEKGHPTRDSIGRHLVAKAQSLWAAKAAEQEAKRGENCAALARLFDSMSNLECVEITEWSCTLKEHHIIDYPE
ncbi:hypothetical protein N0V83_010705 [Neocucurbitaria cava]|uniref:Uncharacterized protein n=1 Tax=Neocucurbitaria cava TaxID=798079 RepID=A0A9W8XYX7_9PLEO|nr:hypothetical protein N0V83_010705 [Neocucurbitaria cava]